MDELHHLSATEQAAAIRRGEVSPKELVGHYLERIESLSDAYGAFVTVTAERALAAAEEAERRIRSGGELPPLLGVPTAVKDLNLVAGVPVKFGSSVMADFVSPIDDHVVTLLERAGLISLGKTNTPEFGLCCYTEPEVAPPARTPFDPTCSAGGSSGGAGAAIAAGLVPFAQGNDGAGSIRIPASVCGLVGLKPSRGRVSGGPVMTDVSGLSVNGPLARTVADVAAMLDAVAGPMPGDPYWAPPLPPGESFQGAAQGPVGRLRVGLCAKPVISDATLDPSCQVAFEEASKLLEELGHEIEECPPPFGPELVPVFEAIWSVGAATIPVPEGSESELRPLTQWLRERGRSLSGKQAVEALVTAQAAARAALVASERFDAVLTPTLAKEPAPVGGLRNDADPAADFDAQKNFTPFTAPANITGQPAISLPLHFTDEGLPIGVQLVGRPAGESLLLALAAQLEAARPWRQRAPSCW